MKNKVNLLDRSFRNWTTEEIESMAKGLLKYKYGSVYTKQQLEDALRDEVSFNIEIIERVKNEFIDKVKSGKFKTKNEAKKRLLRQFKQPLDLSISVRSGTSYEDKFEHTNSIAKAVKNKYGHPILVCPMMKPSVEEAMKNINENE